jgi:hypothetical protein
MSSDYGHLAQVRDRAMAEPHHPQKLVNVRLDALDSVMKHYVAMVTESADQKGERAVLAGLLRDCDAVLATIEADDSDEAEKVRDLRMALAYALDPYKREGTLL